MTLVTKKDSNKILKDYLKIHGITQHYVATKIGMSDQAFSNLIKDRTKFNGDKAIMVSHALNIPLSIFLDENYT